MRPAVVKGFPVGLKEIPEQPKYADVKVKPVRLEGDVFFNHGYALMDLDGARATVAYYQDSDEDDAQFTETLEASATASTT